MPPKPPNPIIIDDVLPPEGRGGSLPPGPKPNSEVARLLAKYLDDLLQIPGTKFKIGLDPLLAFIPGIGSAAASGSGLLIILESVRSGVSIPVLFRMGANMGINSILDMLPFVGPVGSAFFKSNSRNLKLLQGWQAGQQHAIRRSTTRLFVVFALLAGLIIAFWVALFFFYLWLIQRFVIGTH